MAEVRTLAPNEWEWLDQTSLTPDKAICVAAIDGGRVVGQIYLVNIAHLEGISIDEKYRGGILFHRLVAHAEEQARELGLTQVLAFAKGAQMEEYIERLGYSKMPLTVWQKGLACRPR